MTSAPRPADQWKTAHVGAEGAARPWAVRKQNLAFRTGYQYAESPSGCIIKFVTEKDAATLAWIFNWQDQNAMTNEQQPAEQGRGVGECPEPDCRGGHYYGAHGEMIMCEHCAAIAALTQPKGISGVDDGTRYELQGDGQLRVSLPRQSEADSGSSSLAEEYRRDIQASRAMLSTPQPAQADTTPAAHGDAENLDWLRPFAWTPEQSTAWHRAIPDLSRAFDDLITEVRRKRGNRQQAATPAGGENG